MRMIYRSSSGRPWGERSKSISRRQGASMAVDRVAATLGGYESKSSPTRATQCALCSSSSAVGSSSMEGRYE